MRLAEIQLLECCQRPLQRHLLAVARMAAVARGPSAVGVLDVAEGGARSHTALHGQGIEEGLDGGSHLATASHHHVILEVVVVDTADISLDGARMGIHAHEGRTQKTLIIDNGVDRRHRALIGTMIGEDRHIHWGAEGTDNLLGRGSCLLHTEEARALTDAAVDAILDLLARDAGGERRIGLVVVLLVESRLETTPHMLAHGLLGILLHARVDGREDTEAVGIDVVVVAIALVVLVAPAIERVGGPGDGVEHVLALTPGRIVFAQRQLGHHILLEVGLKVAAHTSNGLFVGEMELQGLRTRPGRTALR